MSLREAEPRGDVCLRAVAEEEEQHDPPFAVVQIAHRARDGGAVEENVVQSLFPVGELVVDQTAGGWQPRHMPGQAHRRRPVSQVMADLSLHAARQVRGQFDARGIAPVDRPHEGERSHLGEVVGPFSTAGVPPRHTSGQWQVSLDQSAPFVPVR